MIIVQQPAAQLNAMLLTLRLDADMIACSKSRRPRGQGYQTDMKRVLREYVLQHTAHRLARQLASNGFMHRQAATRCASLGY